MMAEGLRSYPPDRETCRKMLLRLVRKLGVVRVAALLSVEKRMIAFWITPQGIWKPRERKLVFLIHSLVFEPHKLRSLFDVITCGRFV